MPFIGVEVQIDGKRLFLLVSRAFIRLRLEEVKNHVHTAPDSLTRLYVARVVALPPVDDVLRQLDVALGRLLRYGALTSQRAANLRRRASAIPATRARASETGAESHASPSLAISRV